MDNKVNNYQNSSKYCEITWWTVHLSSLFSIWKYLGAQPQPPSLSHDTQKATSPTSAHDL